VSWGAPSDGAPFPSSGPWASRSPFRLRCCDERRPAIPRPRLSITRRPLTDDEKRLLARTLHERPAGTHRWTLSALLTRLGMAFSLALFLRAFHLPWGVVVAAATALGFALETAYHLRVRTRRPSLQADSTEGLKQDLANGAAQIWEFDVARAWQVGGLDGLSPGYLFEVDREMLIYAATHELLHWQEGRFPTRRVSIHRLPRSKHILTIQAAGDAVKPEPEAILRSELPLSGPVRSELLWRTGLKPTLQARLWG